MYTAASWDRDQESVTLQLKKLVITEACELIHMRRETELLVQNNPKVSDRVKKGYRPTRESFSHKTMIDTRQSPTTTQPDKLFFQY